LGTHPFVLRIRDEAMQPLPNIEVGDIGPKFGFLTKDNGYLVMKNVRIPRTNMLSRYVGINKQG
jgi:acyl-CoA oxidase